jgi:hypothetical protein
VSKRNLRGGKSKKRRRGGGGGEEEVEEIKATKSKTTLVKKEVKNEELITKDTKRFGILAAFKVWRQAQAR